MRGKLIVGLIAIAVVVLYLSGALSGFVASGIPNMNEPKNLAGQTSLGYVDATLTISFLFEDPYLTPSWLPGVTTAEHIGLGAFGDPQPRSPASPPATGSGAITTISVKLTAHEYGQPAAVQTQTVSVQLPDQSGLFTPSVTFVYGNFYVFSDKTTQAFKFEISSPTPLAGGLTRCYTYVFDGTDESASDGACPNWV